ncbi:Gfo/Idh/MocA family protein [Prosthecomicrobium sp. N25]|uniref:Gfo/Idh/MocA family protein n=1 Tax=Prosthecomicrobium sp. N25 TaxID=3129254 RepID=UPI003078381B
MPDAPDRPAAPPRLALAGCGAVARLYAGPALARLAGQGVLAVSALYDPDPAAVDALKALLPGAEAVPRFDALLPKADVVLLAGPPRTRAEQGLAALAAGRAVFAEKPLAAGATAARTLVEAAEAAGVPLGVGLVRRFFPATAAVRSLLAAGAIGTVRRVTWFEGGPFAWPVASPAYFSRSAFGGGVTEDIGTHVVDLLAWWLGPLTLVDAADDAMGGVDANARIRLAAGEAAIDVRLSRDWARPNRAVLEGDRGRLVWDTEDIGAVALEPLDGPPGRLVLDGAPDFVDAYAAQIADFAAAARAGRPPRVPARAGLDAALLVEACRARRRLMDMGWLTDGERAAAARLAEAAP